MRHDAWRRDPASYPLRGELLPRYTDVDIWQHLNNTALISMHGEAVQHALRSVMGPQAWRSGEPVLACAANATDFLAEGQYPAPITWGARLLGVDADGLRIATALFQGGQCIGLHGATFVGWHDGRGVGLEPARVQALRAAGVPAVDPSEPRNAPASGHAAPDLGQLTWHTSTGLRFGDQDARRLASDTWLARCAEQIRVEFLNQVFGGQRQMLGGMMVAHVSLHWIARGTPGVRWDCGCAVAHVGERSLAVRGAMFEAGRCVATCDAVMVAIERESRRSAPLSDAARALLEPFRGHARPGG